MTASPTTAAGLLTARDLLARLAPIGPAVDGADLTLAGDPPDDLAAALAVLHTGVRAALAGKPWWGQMPNGLPVPLDPAAPIPPEICLLCVGGDERWDRIHPAARLDLPALFAPPRPARGGGEVVGSAGGRTTARHGAGGPAAAAPH